MTENWNTKHKAKFWSNDCTCCAHSQSVIYCSISEVWLFWQILFLYALFWALISNHQLCFNHSIRLGTLCFTAYKLSLDRWKNYLTPSTTCYPFKHTHHTHQFRTQSARSRVQCITERMKRKIEASEECSHISLAGYCFFCSLDWV